MSAYTSCGVRIRSTTAPDSHESTTGSSRHLSKAVHGCDRPSATTAPIGTPEDVVCERLERAELWQTAIDAVACPQERVVLIESFLHELPPRDILARHPDLFDSIHDVYMAKRHLLNHLQRSAALREYFDGVEV